MNSRDIRRSYRDKLKTLEWQEFSNAVIERKGNVCFQCGETEGLRVHHLVYTDGCEPWEYPDYELRVLCRECHEAIHAVADLIWVESLRFEPHELELILKRLKQIHDFRKRADAEFKSISLLRFYETEHRDL